MPLLTVSNLQKRYGKIRAVDGLSFEIEPGEVFGLLGPNGAGKTTTITIIATLIRADGGDVSINGTPVATAAAYKRKIGFIPQEVSLSPRLTARENLMLLGRLYDLGGSVLARRVADMLEAVGLSDRAGDLVKTFSGGMKRRLNIAGGLLHEPELILMDEPTAGVDPQARAYIFEIIEGLASEGRAILYTTHYMEEAERLCRRTAIIDHGKILAIGTLAELTREVRAKRDLVVEAARVTPESIGRLAARLDDVPWTIDDGTAHLNIADSGHSLLDAVRAADDIGLEPTSISIREPNLETVFLELTGRALRD